MMSDHDLDEVTNETARNVRMLMMVGGRALELGARLQAQKEQRREAEARDVFAGESERRDLARSVYEPVSNSRGFDAAGADDIAVAYTLAQSWSDVDPRAAAATQRIEALAQDRWGVDVAQWVQNSSEELGKKETDKLAEATPPLSSEIETTPLTQADTDTLTKSWAEAVERGDTDTVRRTERELGERLNVDVENYLRRIAEAERAGLVSDALQDRGVATLELGKTVEDLHKERVGDPDRERFEVTSTGIQDLDDLEARQTRMNGQAKDADKEVNEASAAAVAARETSKTALPFTAEESAESGRSGQKNSRPKSIPKLGKSHDRGL